MDNVSVSSGSVDDNDSIRQRRHQRQQQQQQQQSSQNFYDAAGTEKYNQCCLTRSEIYALVRETINKRKHTGDVKNVCDHVFDRGFSTQIEYIRNNLDKALITVGGQRAQCKRLHSHGQKLNRIFKLNKSLEDEYLESSTKYVQYQQQ
jgi:hypothetical protein